MHPFCLQPPRTNALNQSTTYGSSICKKGTSKNQINAVSMRTTHYIRARAFTKLKANKTCDIQR